MSKFLTKAKFSRSVELTMREKKLSCIDAVINVCEESNIDPADVKKFLTTLVKEKIEAEAKALNCLPKGSELPI